MKSSINPQPESVFNWQPQNLEPDDESQQIPEGYVQRLLEIFQSPEEVLREASAGAGKFRNDKFVRSVSDWSPPELEELTDTALDDMECGGALDLDPLLNREQFLGAKTSVSAWNPLEFSAEPVDGADQFQETGFDENEAQIEETIPLEPIPDPHEIIQQALEEADALVKARLAEAKQQADQIIQQTKAEVEAAREQASVELEISWQQAHKEIAEARERAMQEGKAEGVAAGYAEMESAIQTSRNILEQFYAWRNEMLAQSEDTVLGMVQEIARVLFSDGFELDKNTLQQTFSKVLTSARSLGDLRVYVNPEDARQLDPSWREYQSLVASQNIKIFPTEAIRRGGCYVEGQQGTIDARVETQLTALLESLARAGEAREATEDEASE